MFSQFQKNILNKILDESQKPNRELEIRFHTSDEVFANFYNYLLDVKHPKTGTIEQNIQVLLEGRGQTKRKEIYYSKGVKTKESYIVKKSINRLKIRAPIEYKIVVASETPTDPFNINLAQKIRVKLRSSIIINKPALSAWRFDCTVVRTIEKQSFGKLATVKNSMFSKSTDMNNFLNFKERPKVGIEDFEIEAEYIGDQIATLQNIEQCVQFMLQAFGKEEPLDSEYQNAIQLLVQTFIPAKHQSRFRNVALKQIANQPIALGVEAYQQILPNLHNYYLSDKADGERCFILVQDGVKIISSDSIVETDLKVSSASKMCVLDAEVMGLGDSSFKKIYVFDILMFNDENLTVFDFEKREEYIDKFLKGAPKKIEKKILVRLTDDYPKQIKKVYERSTREYPIDGLIFTPAIADFVSISYSSPAKRLKFSKSIPYFDMTVYKWKPPEQLTIDFMIVKPPKRLLGIKPYEVRKGFELYFLFVGIRSHMFKSLGLSYVSGYREIMEDLNLPRFAKYFPIQFSPARNPKAYIYYHRISTSKDNLHKHVGEFLYNVKTNEWKLERMRPDRDINIQKGTGFGNDFKTADMTFQSYFNPLTFNDLIKPPKSGYFAEVKGERYKPLTKFNNFVKAQLLRQFEGFEWIVDLASGKGQDLFTYNGFKVKNGVFIDIDANAIEELNRRKYQFNNPKFYVHNKKPAKNMKVYSKVADLSNPSEETLKTLSEFPVPIGGVNGVAINLAIHYIIKDTDSLNNIIQLVSSLLKPGGIFIFTCFDGQRIFELLRGIETGKSWDLRDETLKYSIKKLYKSKVLTNFGQKIGVIHPFSKGEYYEENIVNIDHVIKMFERHGFVRLQYSSFGDWHAKFNSSNPKMANKMTKDDKLYSSLYSYVSLKKKISKK